MERISSDELDEISLEEGELDEGGHDDDALPVSQRVDARFVPYYWEPLTDLGPDFFASASVWEVRSYYMLLAATTGFTSLGGLYGLPLITYLAAGASDENGNLEGGLRYTSLIQILSILGSVMALLSFVFISPLADSGNGKRVGLFVSLLITEVSIQMVWLCAPDILPSAYLLVAVLFIIAVTASGLAGVYLAAYLPILARQSREVIACRASGGTPERCHEKERRMFDKISSWSTLFSFGGTLVALALSVALVLLVEKLLPASWSDPAFVGLNQSLISEEGVCGQAANTTLPSRSILLQYRVALSFGGLWLLGLTLPAYWLLQAHPNPKGRTKDVVVAGLRMLFLIPQSIKELPQQFLFLAATFFFGAGVGTITFSAPTLFSQELGLSGTLLGAAVLCSVVFGGAGAMVALFLLREYPWVTTKNLLIASLMAVVAVPVWTLVALKHVGEAFAASCYFGFCLGVIGASSRSLYSRMIPPGRESEMSSLIAIVSQVANWLGSSMVIALNERTCNYRLATFAVIAWIIIGTIVLFFVQVERGVERAKATQPHLVRSKSCRDKCYPTSHYSREGIAKWKYWSNRAEVKGLCGVRVQEYGLTFG